MPKKITVEYLASQGLSPNFPERFWKKVQKLGRNKCWLWIGSRYKMRGKLAYGHIFRGGHRGTGMISAHRASWILHKGPIPPSKDVLHNCDPAHNNKACINPTHLKLGNDSENQKEAFAQGEQIPPSGEKNGFHKLTEDEVKIIRSRYIFRGGINSGKSIALEFGVTPACITQIVLRQHWKHV